MYYYNMTPFYNLINDRLVTDTLAYLKAKILYTYCTVFRKVFIRIRQNLHGIITNINKINHHLNVNAFATTHRITIQRAESFLLITTGFNIPT